MPFVRSVPANVAAVVLALLGSACARGAPVSVDGGITIAPLSVVLTPNAQQAFGASVVGLVNQAVVWSVKEGSTGGSISADGLYTAPAAPGRFHVLGAAVAGPFAAEATVEVAAVPVTVQVVPSAVSLAPGATFSFAGTATGALDTAISWSVQEGAAGGSVTLEGLYTAPANPGSYHVVATAHADETKHGSAEVTVAANPVVMVVVDPPAEKLLIGASVTLTATVTGSPDTAVVWSMLEGPYAGTVTGGVYTAPSTPGTYHVIATSDADPSRSSASVITVSAPPPVTVSLAPKAAVVLVGGSQAFSCDVTGATDLGCDFSVQEGAAGGSVSVAGASAATYSAPATPGTYHVVATSHADGVTTDTATITVVPPVAVALSPKSVSLITGAAQPFSCSVTGSADTACTFSIQEGAAGGTVNAAGGYTAPGVAGTYHLVATSHADPSKSDAATVTVTKVAIAVSPKSVALLTGAAQPFSCAVTGSSDATCTWSIQEGAAGGTISAAGAYTAPASGGTYHVIATSHADPTKSDTATVTATKVSVTISPKSVALLTGVGQAFSCAVTGSADTACTWSIQEGAAGGTLNGTGSYTAPAVAGTYHVVATSHADPTKSDTATVTVTTVAVAVGPKSVSLLTSGAQAFTCTVTGSADTACTWSVQEGAAGGTVNGTGSYTAPGVAGTYHVVATSHADPTKSDTATVTVATLLIAVSPKTVSLITNAAQAFTCTVSGSADTACGWAVQEGASGGTVSGTGAYTAPAIAGTYHVVATSHADPTKTDVATVTVTSVSVAVSPKSPSLITGAAQLFACTVTGSADTVCTWAVQEGAGGGAIGANGGYTAPATPGTYHVVATSRADPTKSDTATVTVSAVAVTINPKNVSVFTGAGQAFTCAVTGSADTACTWSVQEGAAGGTVSGSGSYTAPAVAGTYHVVATSHADPSKSDTATIGVVVPVAITISPKSVSLITGAAQAFTCSVTGSADTSCNWSLQEGAAGGTVSAGAYTAPAAAGTYHVIATSHADPTKSDTATVTVTSVAVTISPKPVALLTNAGQLFTCTVTGSADTVCTWSVQEGAAGGAINGSGSYTAPAVAGTFHVIATSHADPTKSASSTVTVSAPPPVAITISPKTALLTTAGTQTFTCTVTGSIDTVCTWSVTEGAAGGSVTAGAYTAPSSAGTYHVVATSHADNTKTDTAVITVSAATDLVVNIASVKQKMDGFGAADIWSAALSDAQADLFFSPTAGIGLSILRIGIADNGSFLDGSAGSAMSDAKKAIARGAIVWGAPWSPLPSYKDTNNENTGSLLVAHYGDWANSLVNAVNTAKASGVALYGISAQNEPDFNTNGGYAMCLYSGTQMRDFIKVLGPKLAALNPRPKLMAAESSGWLHLWGGGYDYADTIINDATALSYLDILATHQYDIYANVPAHVLPANIPLWETEVSSFDGPSTDINNGITVAGWIHSALVTGGASAWHYWWLIGLNNDNEGLLNKGGVITKRLYTMGNFSKFIRPGFVRLGTTGGPTGVSLSAYRDPVSGALAVVAINTTAAAVPFALQISGASAAALTPWTTSATLNLAAQTALTPTGGRFSATLPATSVTTFVGTAQ